MEASEKVREIDQAAGGAIDNTTAFNEDACCWTLVGSPSATGLWGFRFDGHHLVINYFVLGGQVVVRLCFWGSEPASMEIDGESVSVCREEVVAGLVLINSLTEAQKAVAIESATKPTESMKAKLAEVRRHLGDTYVAWAVASAAASSASPGAQPGRVDRGGLPGAGPLVGALLGRQPYGAARGGGPPQKHVHAVIRTSDGSDCGGEFLGRHCVTSADHQWTRMV